MTLVNENVSPIVIRPFRPDSAAYLLEMQGPDGTIPLKVQAALLARDAPPSGAKDTLTLAPGMPYRIEIDSKRLSGDLKKKLPAGRYRVSAVYEAYDMPAGAWRGVVKSKPREIEVK